VLRWHRRWRGWLQRQFGPEDLPIPQIVKLFKHAIKSPGHTARLAVLLLAVSAPLALTVWLLVTVTLAR
jgi:hypothetical protein